MPNQVNQLVSASEADPDLGFMARMLVLCSLCPAVTPATGFSRGLSSNGTEMYAKGVDRYLPEMRLRRIQE